MSTKKNNITIILFTVLLLVCIALAITGIIMLSSYNKKNQSSIPVELIKCQDCKKGIGDCIYAGPDTKYKGQCLPSDNGICPGNYKKCSTTPQPQPVPVPVQLPGTAGAPCVTTYDGTGECDYGLVCGNDGICRFSANPEPTNCQGCKKGSTGDCIYVGSDSKYKGNCLPSNNGVCPGNYKKCSTITEGYTSQYRGSVCSGTKDCSSGSQAGPGCTGGRHCAIPYHIPECQQNSDGSLPLQNACKIAGPGWPVAAACRTGDMYYTGQWLNTEPLGLGITPWVVYSPDPGQQAETNGALGDGKCS